MVLDTPEEVSCRYQLNGLEKHPTETLQREVRYGGLPPGSYEFWVQCKQADARIIPRRRVFISGCCRMCGNPVGSGFGGCGVNGRHLGIRSLRSANTEPRKSELEQAVAQRSAELLQKNKELNRSR